MSVFPYKLHQLLTDISENTHLSSIISWLPSGKGFQLHEPELFEEILLTKYYPRQTQLKSFKRQLQYYGFDNLGDGIFAHSHFLRGQKELCGQIIHQLPTKSQKASVGGGALQLKKQARGKRAKRTLRKSILRPPAGIEHFPQAMPKMTNKLSAFTQPRSLAVQQAQPSASLAQFLQRRKDKPVQYWDRLMKNEKDRAHIKCSVEKGGLCASQTAALISKAQQMPAGFKTGFLPMHMGIPNMKLATFGRKAPPANLMVKHRLPFPPSA